MLDISSNIHFQNEFRTMIHIVNFRVPKQHKHRTRLHIIQLKTELTEMIILWRVSHYILAYFETSSYEQITFESSIFIRHVLVHSNLKTTGLSVVIIHCRNAAVASTWNMSMVHHNAIVINFMIIHFTRNGMQAQLRWLNSDVYSEIALGQATYHASMLLRHMWYHITCELNYTFARYLSTTPECSRPP